MITNDKPELEQASGWLRTHFDCPNCNFDFSEEGDMSGEVIVCPDCEESFFCAVVR